MHKREKIFPIYETMDEPKGCVLTEVSHDRKMISEIRIDLTHM